RPVRASEHELRAIAQANKTLQGTSTCGGVGAFPRGIRATIPCLISHVERLPQGRGRAAHVTLSVDEAEQDRVRTISRRPTKMDRLFPFRCYGAHGHCVSFWPGLGRLPPSRGGSFLGR